MNIVLGISGSIAAYKACTLARLFIKAGHEVQVVITPAGKEFITPVTLSALTSKPVVSEFFSGRDGSWNSHVNLGLWADAMVIAPATASTIGKMANGISDNMLITTYLSMKAPVFVAPAMDLDMFAHPSTQQNLNTLRSYGNIIIEPKEGELASHLFGKGRMEEPENIFESVINHFKPKTLQGKRVLITAGPTYEKIDPVRFIGNFSSGKMGFALAEACAERGATVELVSGPVSMATPPGNITRTDVVSARQMFDQATQRFGNCDIAILCAAVADYRPEHVADNKIKRNGNPMELHLEPTEDIAAQLGQMKRDGQRLIGFALETDNEIENAQGKLERKHFDFIVMNSMRDKGACFGTETNKVSIISKDNTTSFPLKTKKDVANDILDYLCKHFSV